MQLASLLTPDHVVPDMKADDHWPAIVELVDHLATRDLLFPEDRESALEALKHREEFTSTGVGSGVAIPHAFSEKLRHIIAVFGRSRQGINFDAIDDHPVHFVVLFLVPKEDYDLHLQTLAAIARMFSAQNKGIKEDLLQAAGIDGLLAVIARSPVRA